MNKRKIVVWIARIVVAVILLQTLFFKFTSHPDSVLLFTKLGVESYGRIILGIVELILAVGILVPKTSLKAAWAVLVLMVGAVLTHLFILGIVFNNDSGGLFLLSLVALLSSFVVIVWGKDG